MMTGQLLNRGPSPSLFDTLRNEINANENPVTAPTTTNFGRSNVPPRGSDNTNPRPSNHHEPPADDRNADSFAAPNRQSSMLFDICSNATIDAITVSVVKVTIP